MSLPAAYAIVAVVSLFADTPAALLSRPPAATRAHVQSAPATALTLSAATSSSGEVSDRRIGISLTIPLGRYAVAIRPALPPPPPDPLARALVAAALKQAGLEEGASRYANMAARARVSALLPELHIRVLSSDTDTSSAANTDYSAVLPQNSSRNDRRLWLEGRAVFRLDKLLYSDDEPALLRLRADAMEARARVTAHVLGLYFHWRRASRDLLSALADSPEHDEAELRAEEAAIALDIATGGAFNAAASNPVTPLPVPEPEDPTATATATAKR